MPFQVENLRMNRPGWWGVIGFLSLPLAVYAYLGTFSRYLADEYCYANISFAQGFWGAQAHWYLTWSGRISANALITLGTLAGVGFAAWLPIALLVLWVAGLALSMSLLPFGPTGSARRLAGLMLALAFVDSVFLSLPNLAQNLYWETSSLTYLAPIVMLSWTPYAAAQARILARRLAHAEVWIPAITVASLSFVGAGFSEVWAVVQIVGYGMTLLLYLWLSRMGRFRSPVVAWAGAGLIGSLLMLALNVGSPGTLARQAGFAVAPDVLLIQHNAQLYARWFIRDVWLTSADAQLGLWAVTLLLTGAVASPRMALWMSTRRLVWLLFLGAIGLYILLTAVYAPVFYVIRYLPPPRVLINPGVVWALGVACGGMAVGLWLKREWLQRAQVVPLSAFQIALGLAVAIWLVPAAVQGLSQVKTYRAFASAWDAYDVLLRSEAVRLRGEARLFQLTYPADTEVLGTDPTHWINRCVSDFYDLNQIIADEPPPTVSAITPIPLTSTPLRDRFGSVVDLAGVAVSATQLQPGDTLTVRLYWTPLALTERPYTVFVHLVDPARGSIAQSDSYPIGGSYATDRWLVGVPFSDEIALQISPEAVPTEAAFLAVGLYDLTTLERLPVSGLDADRDAAWVRFGAVTLTP